MRVDLVGHESRLLADNPLGDPAARELVVLLPPSYEAASARRFPVVLVLAGFTGAGAQLALNRAPWTPTLARRLHDLMARGGAAEAILVFPDCFTRYGGSQYLDSPALGRYQSYLADEVVPLVDARFRTIPRREARAVVGKSSGGFGALALALDRPELVCAAGSHAGDAAFDLCYLAELPRVVLALERHGGLDGFLRWFEAQPQKPGSAVEPLSALCCAAAYSPNRGPYGFGRGFDFPLDWTSGVRDDEVWSRWLAHDPVRRAGEPDGAAALAGLRALFLDAGLQDEYNLQLGARQLAAVLRARAIAHTHEEFEGGHRDTAHRYERSLAVLTRVLDAA